MCVLVYISRDTLTVRAFARGDNTDPRVVLVGSRDECEAQARRYERGVDGLPRTRIVR